MSDITVLLADDHAVLRDSLRFTLEAQPDIKVVGSAADGREALRLVQHLCPDVVLMDVAMPEMNGIEATQHIVETCPETHVVILSMYTDETLVRQALRDGARGYLPKSACRDELLLAIRAAHRGETYVSPTVARPVWDSLQTARGESEPRSAADRLTPREREVLQLIVEGHTNRSIAETLTISVKTVEKHRASLMAKLDAHNLAELIRKAIRHRLVLLKP